MAQAGLRSDFSIIKTFALECLRTHAGALQMSQLAYVRSAKVSRPFRRVCEPGLALLYSRYNEVNSTERGAHVPILDPRPESCISIGGAVSGAKRLPVLGMKVSTCGDLSLMPYHPTPQFNREHISGRFDGIFSNNVIEHFRNPVGRFQVFTTFSTRGRNGAFFPLLRVCLRDNAFSHAILNGESPRLLRAAPVSV